MSYSILTIKIAAYGKSPLKLTERAFSKIH
jgi:hypothetical protein